MSGWTVTGLLEGNHVVSTIGEYFIYAVFILGFVNLGLSPKAGGKHIFEFSQTWIWLSIILYIIAIAIAHAVLIPGGKIGVWIAGGFGFLITLGGIVLSFVPPGESENKFVFSLKLVSGTVVAVGFGLVLYYRGVREKRRAISSGV